MNLQGCQKLDSLSAKSLFYICTFFFFAILFMSKVIAKNHSCHGVLCQHRPNKKLFNVRKNWLQRHRCCISVGSIPVWKLLPFTLNKTVWYLPPFNPETPLPPSTYSNCTVLLFFLTTSGLQIQKMHQLQVELWQ